MNEVRMYGTGAVTMHSGKTLIRSDNGVLVVPENMVAQAEAMGYRRTKSGEDIAKIDTSDVAAIAGADDLAKRVPGVDVPPLDTPPAIPPGETLEAKTARYRVEVTERGYMGEVVDAIVAERLRFDELVAGGMSEEDAASKVWGGGSAADTEKVD